MLAEVGCSMIGQTAEIAPADKKLYALRDVTVDGREHPAHHRVDHEQEDRRGHRRAGPRRQGRPRRVHEDAGDGASAWRESLVAIGNRAGVRTEALLTAMDAPLGRDVGNALEVIESIETLKGRGPRDLEDLSVRLAARMVVLAGDADSDQRRGHGARRDRRRAPASRCSARSIAWQGGDPRVDRRLRPAADGVAPARRDGAPAAGYVTDIDADEDRPRGDAAGRRPRPRRGRDRSGRRRAAARLARRSGRGRATARRAALQRLRAPVRGGRARGRGLHDRGRGARRSRRASSPKSSSRRAPQRSTREDGTDDAQGQAEGDQRGGPRSTRRSSARPPASALVAALVAQFAGLPRRAGARRPGARVLHRLPQLARRAAPSTGARSAGA